MYIVVDMYRVDFSTFDVVLVGYSTVQSVGQVDEIFDLAQLRSLSSTGIASLTSFF